ncbi:oxidoreductase [Pilimelia terevasa]|uniref:Oxidoreductase n=1 Tax=Pilimelia terevasa TaxID=53372 RepID=A0A8J3BU75_9ACTN|nr:aldo/keto reductase [Pilimelia terevasa]GGK42940.1 oxidoreductase [Pilimelia terevasa]
MTSTRAPLGGSVTIGDIEVGRLGYGAMRLCGAGIWDAPADPDAALAVLRAAVAHGVTFVDTADSYGPDVSERQIREALHPYEGLLVATKGGLVRTGPDQWHPVGRPEYLRQCVEMSLRRLGVDRIDLWQLHRIDPQVPVEESLGVVREMQDEGKIRHVGLSQVTVAELTRARRVVDIVSVQNLYNLGDRRSEDVVDHCTREGIAFIPWYPVAAGDLARPGGVLDVLVKETGHTAAQLALAWLLRRSPVIAPIPGTSSLAHLAENVAAASIDLDDEVFAALSAAAAR